MQESDSQDKPQFFTKGINKDAFYILAVIVVIACLMGLLAIYTPTLFSIMLNIFWIVLLVVAIIFLFLGILVIIGMKSEVNRVLDILLEGSMTFIDFLDFLRALIKNFILLIKEFILFIAPILAFIVAFILYVILLVVYKNIGKNNDVTNFTILITFLLILVVGFLTRPQKTVDVVKTWGKQVAEKFKNTLNDALEVVVFVFFLTMDSTYLFFLTDDLNIKLRANIGDYDLMVRGFVLSSHLKITLIIIVTAITTEILRNVLRVIINAIRFYKEDQRVNRVENKNLRAVYVLKGAVRKSFMNLKNDLLRFITFTTFLIFVFLLFPRLKLLSVMVSSITFLLLDFLIPDRFYVTKGSDLISRILTALFKI